MCNRNSIRAASLSKNIQFCLSTFLILQAFLLCKQMFTAPPAMPMLCSVSIKTDPITLLTLWHCKHNVIVLSSTYSPTFNMTKDPYIPCKPPFSFHWLWASIPERRTLIQLIPLHKFFYLLMQICILPPNCTRHSMITPTPTLSA